MRLAETLLPLSVSFDNVSSLETPNPGDATNVSGYFQKAAQAGQDLRHRPTAEWSNLAGNSVKDHAWYYPPPQVPGSLPWERGHCEWAIINRYRVNPAFGAGGPGMPFTTVIQTFDMLGEDGTMLITKAGAWVARSPSGRRGAKAIPEPTLPGDYPTPGNPLDMPQTGNAAAAPGKPRAAG
jgi:hypothetical protein